MNDNDNGNGEIKLASPAGERPRNSYSFYNFITLLFNPHNFMSLSPCIVSAANNTKKGELLNSPKLP